MRGSDTSLCVRSRKGNAGLAQEVGNGVLGVACFRTTIYRDLSVSDLGYGILNYARSKMRWCVDAKFKVRSGVCAAPDGECTHLVEAAVISAGAKRPNFRAAPYSWGRIVQSSYLPGDIIQFWGGARLEEPRGNGFWFTSDQHTAIIEKTNGKVVTVIHQNSPTRTVTRQNINLGWNLVKGSYVVYRPIAP